MPREQYPLDSAHHGLAISSAGDTLCAAGTVSDYAAIVDRATFEPTIIDVGSKPYWPTNSADGTQCYVSVSGADRVVVIDYATAQEVTRFDVANHPQRIRNGVIRSAFVGGAAPAAGVPPAAAPPAAAPAAPAPAAAAPTAGGRSLAATGNDLALAAALVLALATGTVAVRRRAAAAR